MKKKHRLDIEASLSKALEAPKRPKPSPALTDILAQYAPPAESGTSTTTPASTSSTTSITQQPVAPLRDFAKVANSIAREAVPAGLFTGKSKQIYDYLYSKTRGAIAPKTTTRIKFKDLMRGAHIGSEVTLRLNLERLQTVGLIAYQRIAGEHQGNEYTVYLPEEITGRTTSTSTSSGTSSSQNLVGVVGVESSTTSTTLKPADSATSGEPKTSFKTDRRTDDESNAFLALLQKAEFQLTGKNSSFSNQQWRELAELLIAELKIAAARTGSVSSVPAFLTEHLRRRLFKKSKEQMDTESREAPETSPVSQIDASKCPDCGGSSWWYPEGTEKGVAKCKHARLVGINEEGQ